MLLLCSHKKKKEKKKTCSCVGEKTGIHLFKSCVGGGDWNVSCWKCAPAQRDIGSVYKCGVNAPIMGLRGHQMVNQ